MPVSPKTRRPIYIMEPMCGLCNRLRAIDGLQGLLERNPGRAHVIWYADADLNCRFTDLFHPLPEPFRFWHFSLSPRIEQVFKNLLHAIMKRSCNVYILQHETERLVKKGCDFYDITAKGSVFIKTWDCVRKPDAPFALFRPLPHIQSLIDAQIGRYSHTVGVHIRRTDCNQAIALSTTDKFVAAMQAELEAKPETTFFLATDDPNEEAQMNRLFPRKILTYQKRTRDRNRKEGIEDAVVDLYCLGACSHVLGSATSSFSETAMTISNRLGRYV